MTDDISMPLEVMLHEMRRHWREGRVDAAVALAKAAAPYMHARAAAGRAATTLGALEDDKLDELCGRGFDGAAPPEGNTE